MSLSGSGQAGGRANEAVSLTRTSVYMFSLRARTKRLTLAAKRSQSARQLQLMTEPELGKRRGKSPLERKFSLTDSLAPLQRINESNRFLHGHSQKVFTDEDALPDDECIENIDTSDGPRVPMRFSIRRLSRLPPLELKRSPMCVESLKTEVNPSYLGRARIRRGYRRALSGTSGVRDRPLYVRAHEGTATIARERSFESIQTDSRDMTSEG